MSVTDALLSVILDVHIFYVLPTQAWFYGEGLSLPVEMDYDQTLAKQTYDLALNDGTLPAPRMSMIWCSSQQTLTCLTPIRKVSSQEELENRLRFINQTHFHQVVFLERLQSYPALPPPHIDHLGELYVLSTSTNAELRFRFYQLALLDPSMPESKVIARTAGGGMGRQERRFGHREG